ncbi:MAG: GDP-L-fucose synthase family protein [Flavobacteriales bacterium]
MNKNSAIYIAGHNGMVGSAIHRLLTKEGFTNLIIKSSKELDLTNTLEVEVFFKKNKIEYVFLAAAKVGGIVENKSKPAEFLYQNLKIQNNVIHYSFLNDVKKLLFLGSSCIYPKFSSQPIKENSLLSGYLEPTNKSYAIAKIAGIQMCDAYREQYGCNFISAMPTNLYGPNDNYDLNSSHVLPALLRKFYEASLNNEKTVQLWGDGTPLREFLHVDDCASACLFLMQNYNQNGAINVGTGKDITIMDLAKLIANEVGYCGEIVLDRSKPNGTPKKQLDVSKINALGWKSEISLEQGICNVLKILPEELKK